MVKFEIRQIDAWAEAEGGWTWNNSIKVGEFQTRAADQKRAFLYAFHKLGIVCKRGRMAVVYDGDIYELQDRRTNEPLFAAIPC